jgi:hypothetical protein
MVGEDWGSGVAVVETAEGLGREVTGCVILVSDI